MARLNEIIDAGLTPDPQGRDFTQRSEGQKILSAIGRGLGSGFDKAVNKESVEKEKDKVELFIKLREAGYSKEEAAEKVNEFSGGKSFFQKVLGRKQKTFNAPEGEDAFDREQEEEKLDRDLKKSKIAANNAKAQIAKDGQKVFAVKNGKLTQIGRVGKDDKVFKTNDKEPSIGDLTRLADPFNNFPEDIRKNAEERLRELGLGQSQGRGSSLKDELSGKTEQEITQILTDKIQAGEISQEEAADLFDEVLNNAG